MLETKLSVLGSEFISLAFLLSAAIYALAKAVYLLAKTKKNRLFVICFGVLKGIDPPRDREVPKKRRDVR